MSLRYDKLWYRLNERGLKKKDLMGLSGISRASMAKLAKNEIVTTDILNRICDALQCDISDIAEIESSAMKRKETQQKDGEKVVYGLNSFFSGIGGFDIAFERHGFVTKYLCEINDFCNEILELHWPEVRKEGDICEIDGRKIPEADIWCGGFPCQDVSVARGAAGRKGLNGNRSGLFFQFASLVEQCNPKIVVIENVEGLLNSNSGRDFGVIIQKMMALGYAVSWRLLNSRYFGVPQSRPRVYICCWKGAPHSALRVLFEEQGAYKPTNERKGFLTVAEKQKKYPIVPQVSYCLAATSGRHTGTDWSRTYVVCDDGVRRMTPKEYERLQGFPDDWTLSSSTIENNENTDTLRYTAIGNAVSVPVIEWIAKRIHQQMTSSSGNTDKDSLQTYVPEFKKVTWSNINIDEIDFSNDLQTYKWPKAGLAWAGEYIGTAVPPTPSKPISSSMASVVEMEHTDRRYYLTPNAAEGILRRVDNQGRKLFPPLREALEREKERETR